ncbi:class I SAM-dependent RNA methyltransferase [Hyphococcus lacteus]|uniref:RNA methyltransferase n=1 Tax=Hyphococcus lacteus TaxID=3143536 RepID=A0ABV3Z424_9PROT
MIEKLGARGDGLAMVDGKPIYIPYTVPNDKVEISFRGERGTVRSILNAGPDRVTAPCNYYGTCGGCLMQHVSEQLYMGWKRDIVVSALRREGFDEDVIVPLQHCTPASRRRAQFAIRKTKDTVLFGFNERGSSALTEISECIVLAPELDAAIHGLKAIATATPSQWRKFDMMATLCDNGIDVSITGGDADEDDLGASLATLVEVARENNFIRLSIDDAPVVVFSEPVVRFGAVDVSIPPGVFLQASREGEQRLIDLVVPYLAAAKRVADLFSGCGTFSFAVDAHVDAFDIAGPAIEALEIAARRSNLRHPTKAHRRNLFDRPLLPAELNSYGAVIFDPPRAGAQAQSAQLAKSNVPIIIGVSCNPTSFARDAAILREGGYELSHVTPVDQFVYAAHVELVGVFRKG